MSDVGGAIGLWIGLSILSLFELVQLVLEMGALAGHKCCGESKPKDRSEAYRKPEPPRDEFANHRRIDRNYDNNDGKRSGSGQL
jgi:hypothetical protein